MISCYQFKTFMSGYIDKDLSFQKRKYFEEHLDVCPQCQKLYHSIITTKTNMGNFPDVSVSENFLSNLQNKILAERNARIQADMSRGFALRRIPSFAYGFAAALLAVIIGFYLLEFQPNTRTPQAPPKLVQERIRPNPSIPNYEQSNPAMTTPGQLANSESARDSLADIPEPSSNIDPDFQNKIKTVKETY